MQFIIELKQHLENFESGAKEEIRRFLDAMHVRYAPPAAAVVAKPETSYVEPEPTFIAPVIGDNIPTSIVSADQVNSAASVVEPVAADDTAVGDATAVVAQDKPAVVKKTKAKNWIAEAKADK
jgi:hypothetical protein